MISDTEIHDKRKQHVDDRKEAMELRERLLEAYTKCTGKYPFGGIVVEDNDESIIKKSTSKEYAEAKFALHQHYLEKILDNNPMEFGSHCKELSKTVRLSLSDRTEEAIGIIKESAINCIAEKDIHYATRAMTGVAIALCDIAKDKPEFQPLIRDSVGAIMAVDKTKAQFSPSSNLEFVIQRMSMQNNLLPTKSDNKADKINFVQTVREFEA